MRTLGLLITFLAANFSLLAAGTALDLGTARLSFQPQATVSIQFTNGVSWPASQQAAFELEGAGTNYPAKSVRFAGDKLFVSFGNGAKAEFKVRCGEGFALFQLVRLDTPQPTARFRLFQLAAPTAAEVSGTLNGASLQGNFAAVMAAKPNVHAFHQAAGGSRVDRAGCAHDLTLVAGKVGTHAARFTATCDSTPGGWSMSGRDLAVRDLTGCRELRAWVHGDGRGEALKIQLYDGAGGYRDDYVAIDFQGWRQVTLTNPALNTLRYDRVSTLNLYYNGLPASMNVTCLVDHIEAVIERGGKTTISTLEDFEDAHSPLLTSPANNLCVETESAHGIEPAAFGVIACHESDFAATMQRFEVAADLPHPRSGGVWNKQSPRVKRSYLFLTNFRESQLEQGLALARRGGFDTVLLGQESWTRGTGHYEIDRARYADGLDGLQRTVQRFKEAGFHVGLHLLGASIYPPDSYLTPTPDLRLVKGASASLAEDITATTNYLPVNTTLADFPDEDGGYMGKGLVLQVGQELIVYGAKTKQAPWGFSGCSRGHLGTRAAAHQKGEPIRHLVRSYGYHMYDMDTSILDEVASNFARVANYCGIEMVYFDGSELLQGDHWYYNARLHQSFYDKLDNKDTLLQASSYSHYSWHLLARSASADGHGDLKGYLDQRSGGFPWMARNWMPLDIGWYYGYDPTATPDMFEYVLGATIGYDSSMSFQVSCEAAAAHPFTGEILDLIARYEKLRLSGQVPEAVKARLRIDPALQAIKPGENQPELVEKRCEWRLGQGEKQFLQRVSYEPWHEISPAQTNSGIWRVNLKHLGRLGVQIHAAKGTSLVDPWLEIQGRRWNWTGTLRAGEFLFFQPGQGITRYAPHLSTPEVGATAPDVSLPPGEWEVTFGTREPLTGPARVRLTLELPERLEF